jgi:hypothetical protein
MGFFEINSTAAQQAIAYMGRQFTFRGTVYRAIVNEVETDPDLQLGGNQPNISLAIYVRKTGFPPPAVGELVQFEGTSYRISSILSDVISYTLNVEDPAQ